jgi:predicted transcriptional regulator
VFNYTRAQGSGAEEMKSSGSCVKGYEVMNRLIVGSAMIRKLLASAFVFLFDTN